jgi:hypothetical protein
MLVTRRVQIGLVSGFAAVAALGSSPATPASATPAPTGTAGGVGLRLVDVPVAAETDPRARIYIVDHLAPGTVVHRRVEVSNTTLSAAHVALYAAAAGITDGSFLGAAARTSNDLSTWISVVPGSSDVPAGGRAMVTVTIAVPRDATRGEQYAVIWAEVRSAPGDAGGVIEVSRVGVRVYLYVGSGGAPASAFTIDSLTARRSTAGAPSVLATVHNTGARALDMSGTLRLLAGPGGLTAGPFPANLGTTLAVGDTRSVTIVLDKHVPDGPWDARIALHSGLLERRARATITFPPAGASRPVKAVTGHAGSRSLWLVLAIAGVLISWAAALWLVLAKRARRRSVSAPVPNDVRRVLGRVLSSAARCDPLGENPGLDRPPPAAEADVQGPERFIPASISIGLVNAPCAGG